MAYPIPKLRYVLCDRKGPVSLHATMSGAIGDYAQRTKTIVLDDVSKARTMAAMIKHGWSIKRCKAWFTFEK